MKAAVYQDCLIGLGELSISNSTLCASYKGHWDKGCFLPGPSCWPGGAFYFQQYTVCFLQGPLVWGCYPLPTVRWDKGCFLPGHSGWPGGAFSFQQRSGTKGASYQGRLVGLGVLEADDLQSQGLLHLGHVGLSRCLE